jgi:ubiquinone/menaquinone biosynthesis C-methylase UbiE
MTDYLKNEYDLDDPSIVSILDECSYWSAPFGIRLLDTVRYKRNIRALDIGFGLGFPLIELAMRLGSSSRIYGIDPWHAGMERARWKKEIMNVQNVELIRGLAEDMPFEDSFFDLLVSNNGINNVQSLSKTLTECSRVAKPGAQFVFTFNLEETFIEFYSVYRAVLRALGLQEYDKNIDTHIYSKRLPLTEMKTAVEDSGFRVIKVHHDRFDYRFADGTALLNHFFIKAAFLPAWKEIVPPENAEDVFRSIEAEMNRTAEEYSKGKDARSGYAICVPFATFDCEKK